MPEHKYTVIAKKLRESINSGHFPPGSRLPSENELANHTGFSRQTIRQAMSMLEKEGLTVRIQGSGTYVRNIKKIRERTNNIAVVTTYIGEYIFPDILHGIDSVLEKNGYTPLLFATHNKVENERKILEDLLNKPIDGLIVEGTKTALPNPNIDLYEQLDSKGIPVIFINGFYRELKNPLYVVTNDHEGGKMACQVLLRHKKEHIAGIFKSDDIQGLRRYSGFAQALRQAGKTVEDDHILWYTTERQDSFIEMCSEQVLSGCDGVVCYNDEVALKLLKTIQNSKKVNPNIEVVSFDNSTYAKICAKPFFSLQSPKELIGTTAAEKMVSVLQGKAERSTVLVWNTKSF